MKQIDQKKNSEEEQSKGLWSASQCKVMGEPMTVFSAPVCYYRPNLTREYTYNMQTKHSKMIGFG